MYRHCTYIKVRGIHEEFDHQNETATTQELDHCHHENCASLSWSTQSERNKFSHLH